MVQLGVAPGGTRTDEGNIAVASNYLAQVMRRFVRLGLVAKLKAVADGSYFCATALASSPEQ